MFLNKNVFNQFKKKFIFISIFVFLLFIFSTYKYERLCLDCINKIKNNKCFICRNNIIFKGIKIYNDDVTLNEIINKNKSISRFGDGEFRLIFGKNIGFQKYNKILSKRLLSILNTKEKNLLIGINVPYQQKILDVFNYQAKTYYTEWLDSIKFKLAKILKNKEYYSSTITRFYIDLESKKGVPEYIRKLKMIWNDKEIVIIEGDKSRLGIGNDLFNNSKLIQRVICPTINAFNSYSKILNTVKQKVNKNKLILIALGPTATLLSFDLYKLGYKVLDIGHIDIEYEWYLRKAKKKIPIRNKYVNEKKRQQKSFTPVKDKNYYNQIIAKITN